MEQHHLEAYTTIIYQFIERIIQLFLKYNNYNIKCSSIYFMVFTNSAEVKFFLFFSFLSENKNNIKEEKYR